MTQRYNQQKPACWKPQDKQSSFFKKNIARKKELEEEPRNKKNTF